MTGKINNEENTRELALRVITLEETRKKTDPNESHEKSIIVVGSKEVGKTTMIHRFLEKEDAPKPTLATDYSYGRKAGKSLVKDVVHVWEIGHLSSALITGAMTGCALGHSPHHTTVLIMLDLSKPETLWNSLEECLDALSKAMKASYPPEVIQEMRERKLEALSGQGRGGVGADEPRGDLFPMRLCVVAGKYDEFRKFEGVDREFVGQMLRAAAHSLGATLHYHTAKDSQLLRRTKELLSHYGFKGHPTKASVTDYDKPLLVPAGSDSYDAIGLELPRRNRAGPMILDYVKQIYATRFPQVSGTVARDDVASEPEDEAEFAEAVVDRLRSQREQEISVLLRDMLEAPAASIPIPEPY